jgi:hypothetical protein
VKVEDESQSTSLVWRARRYPWGLVLVFGFSAAWMMGIAISALVALSMSIFSVLICFFFASIAIVTMRELLRLTREIAADERGMRITAFTARTRVIAASNIAGVFPSLPSSKASGTVRIVLRDRVRPRMLNILLILGKPSDLPLALLGLFGRCTVPPLLMPKPEVFDSAERHYVEHGEFRWRPRLGWLFSSLGIKSLAWFITLPFGWRAIEQWIQHNHSMSWWGLLMASAVGGVSIGLGVSTLFELLQGGHIVEIRATTDGITIRRWWRSVQLSRSDITDVCVQAEGFPIGTIVNVRTSDPRVRWRFVPRWWHGPLDANRADEQIGMIAPFIMLYEPAQRPLTAGTDGNTT